MKKLFFFLVFLAPLVITAQVKDYNNLSSNSVLNKVWNTDYKTANEVSDNLFLLLGKSYIRENFSNKGGYYVVAFYPNEFDRSPDTPSISFTFSKGTIGANKDLGIEGKRVFNLYEIEGTFLDLYVIWESFCKDLSITPENKETIVNKLPKKSNQIFWQNSEKRDYSIQFRSKNYGDSNRWVIDYSVYSK